MTLTLKGLKNHNFTITTNTSQHVEFFHSLIFHLFCLHVTFSKILVGEKNQNFMLIRLNYSSNMIGCGGDVHG